MGFCTQQSSRKCVYSGENSVRVSLLLAILGALLPPAISAQGISAVPMDPASISRYLVSASFGNSAIQRIQLIANASWQEGGETDSGTATLMASNDGSSQLQLSLSTLGQRTEAQTGGGQDANCLWAGNDGAEHTIDPGNCLRPALWFLPVLSLEFSPAQGNVSITDQGIDHVGSGQNLYWHIQEQFLLTNASAKLTGDFAQKTTTDLGVDPATLLPSVLAYSLSSDSGGAGSSIPVEIHYSDYRPVQGVQIPFHIQRFLNGSLQLDIHISEASIN